MSQTSGKPAEVVWGWLQRQFGNNALMLVLLGVTTLVAGFKGRDKIGEVTDEQLAPVRRQVDEHEQKLRHHNEDLHQVELDMREMYKTLPRVRDSERLERPWPAHDGGEP